jgi:hypothetical protein
MTLFITLSGVGFILIALLWITQRLYLNNLLEVGRKKRVWQMQEINDKQLSLTKQGVDPYVDVKSGPLNYLYIIIFIACLIAAWVLFFVYATGGQVAV